VSYIRSAHYGLHRLDKKVKMIFVTSEKSQQHALSVFFQQLYDGTRKEYPNGAMLLFIPLIDKTQMTPEYRNKIIYNHERFLGEEAALCIGGLQDLNTVITIKKGAKITLRMLLKSIPATQGMSCPQLFQFVEPNSSGVVTLATFNSCDKAFIDKRRKTLEDEIRSLIDHTEESKVFLNPEDGIWFGGVNKTKNGKIIPSQQINKQTAEHIQKIYKNLPSPPKKRQNQEIASTNKPQTPNTIQYNYTIRETNTSNLITPNINTPHQQSPPVTETKFDAIAEEFNRQRDQNEKFEQRITCLETTTDRIDHNINAILSKMEKLDKLDELPMPSKQRKLHDTMNIDENTPPRKPSSNVNTGGSIQCVI
jgi:hypothetical protein